MDANRQKFWMLADKEQWHCLGDPPDLEYDAERRSLRLANQRRLTSFEDLPSIAQDRLDLIPQTLDQHGNRAYWDSEDNSIVSTGAMEDEMVIYTPASESGAPSDIAMGHDGILYIAIHGQVVMHDRRDRWADTTVSAPEFNAWRLAAIPNGGAWVLDREDGKLGRVQGQPFPRRPFTPYAPGVFRPCSENPDPPELVVLDEVAWPNNETPVAVACNPEGKLALLSWNIANEAFIRYLDETNQLTGPIKLNGVNSPYSMSWASSERIAVLLAGVATEAPVYKMSNGFTSQWPVGDLYPLKQDFNGGPFLHGVHFPPHYSVVDGSRALHQLSFPFFIKQGFAFNNRVNAPMDSGNPQMIWHRLYLETVIPKDCGIKVWLAASDKHVATSVIMPNEWYEHQFGALFEKQGRSDVPHGVWEYFPSELPHHPGLLPCDTEHDIAGLFSVLIQRAGRQVRSLQGRFLHVRVELIGNGHNTPEIFALRAYGSRFQYVQEYLPQLYWETTYAPEANDRGNATRADFFERFVHNVEGVLTNLEDRVGHSYLLTHPQTVPEDSLDWLGSWIGYEFDQTQQYRRDYLQHASDLYRWHGTLRGLKLALEIGTGGGISGGEIVVLEDFRLRRTFATILGADFQDEDDPLTAGAAISGNSFVGDTLFLGDERKKEFLALFAADLPTDTSEQAAIDAFFDRLAYRVTILIHEEAEPHKLGLIQQIAEREMPAHVELRVLTTTYPFLVGVAALVGVDSYLVKQVVPGAVRIGHSHIGRRDIIQGPGSLDPRLEGIGTGLPRKSPQRPIAFARDVIVERGQSVTLDASDSRASQGREIVEYRWRYQEERRN